MRSLRVPLISATASAAPSFRRIAWASLVVVLANAALLVLQLVAGRLLAPFIGSSLETWTAVIGVFLLGISLGNSLGGRLADRAPDESTLRWTLLLGAVTTLATLGLVKLLGSGEPIQGLPLGLRIPLLTLVTCLPPSLVLSLITPVTIKLMLPDVRRTGRVVGLVYALGTLGSLAGNFLTGFKLLMQFDTHTIVLGIAAALLVLGVLTHRFTIIALDFWARFLALPTFVALLAADLIAAPSEYRETIVKICLAQGAALWVGVHVARYLLSDRARFRAIVTVTSVVALAAGFYATPDS